MSLLAGKDRQKLTWRLRCHDLLAFFLYLQAPPIGRFTSSHEVSLPACCRRHGKHHCAMDMDRLACKQSSQNSPAFAQLIEKCLYTPMAPASWHGQIFSTLPTQLSIFAEVVSHPVSRPQTEARRRIFFLIVPSEAWSTFRSFL